MNTINNDVISIIKDMPQESVALDVITVGDRQFYEYKIEFLIDQIAAYSAGVRTMKVDIAYKRVGKNFSLLSGKTFAKPSDFNDQVLGGRKSRIDFIEQRDKEQKDNNIQTKNVDIFSRSRKISQFRLKSSKYIDLASITTKFETTSLLQNNQVTKLTASDLIKNSDQQNTSASGISLYSNLVLRGKDPANQIKGMSLVEDATRARKGLTNIAQEKQSIAGAFTSVNLQGNKNNLLSPQLTVQKRQNLTTDILLQYVFRFPTSTNFPNGKFSVICTIRKEDGTLVQKTDFIINHSRQLIKYSIPRQLPVTGIQFITKSTAQVNVFNKDSRVSNVRIYKRDLLTYQTIDSQSSYSKIATIPADWKQQVNTSRLSLKSSTNTLIRTVPVLSTGIVLGNFESKTHTVKSDLVGGIVVAVSNKSNVTIDLYSSPANYAYVQFVKRSVDLKHKNWSNVGNPIKMGEGVPSIDDYDVLNERTYEYSAFLQDTHGNIKRVRTSSFVRVTDYTAGTELKVTQKNSTTTSGTTTTTFDVSVTLTKDSDTTAILTATKEQGIEKYFEQETLKLSGDLSSITKVNVRRLSLATGEIKDLGAISPGEFTDTTTENVVYIFEGLLRGQADLFEQISSDKTTKKTLNPRDALQRSEIVSSTLTSTPKLAKVNFTQKFLSKKSLLRGTLSYGNTKSSDIDASGFLQGRLGITETFEITKKYDNVSITNFDLVVADEKNRLLSFDVRNTTNQKFIDFFIISTDRGGIRSVIGTCHYIEDNVRQHFLDNKTRLKNGNVSYVITPVKYDGSTLSEVATQQFEVM